MSNYISVNFMINTVEINEILRSYKPFEYSFSFTNSCKYGSYFNRIHNFFFYLSVYEMSPSQAS